MSRKRDFVRAEVGRARRTWPEIGASRMANLRDLIRRYRFSVTLGDLLHLESGWYVTHTGLLRMANRRHCSGIKTILQGKYSDPSLGRWVFKAVVYNSRFSRGFAGYGDADPSNVSPLVHGAEMRVAETRAVNRALRKAYGIGLCSVEELGWTPRANDSGSSGQSKSPVNGNNGHQNGQPRLRDRLCLLIRQYHLDAGLVKAYAADFCNTPSLREASKEQVQAFIDELARRAASDLPGLICQLNSYAKPQESES